MVNPIEKQGHKATETIYEGDFIEGEEINGILDIFEECTYYECSECFEQYDNFQEAKECCEDENED